MLVSCLTNPPFLDGGHSIQRSDRPFTFHFAVLMEFGVLGITLIIRWGIVSRITSYHKLLFAVIAGLALSEGAIFYEIFLLPDDLLN